MKLLLDEMWSPTIAVQPRARGYDVVAVAERDELRGLSDTELVAWASREGRVTVTENVPDFRRIAAAFDAANVTHRGLILTTNWRYSRHDDRVIGRMVRALEAILRADAMLPGSVVWLS